MAAPVSLTPDEERETVSYVLPKRLSKAVARHAVDAELKSKSAAAADIIERGLTALIAEESAERQAVSA